MLASNRWNWLATRLLEKYILRAIQTAVTIVAISIYILPATKEAFTSIRRNCRKFFTDPGYPVYNWIVGKNISIYVYCH